MDHQSNRALQQFRNEIGIKFQLYNSLFTSLPFHRIEKTEEDPAEDFKNMVVGDAKIDGSNATVSVTNKKKNETVDFPLKKEDGSWKVDFSMGTLMKMGMDKAKEDGTEINPEDIDKMKDFNMDSLKKGFETIDSALKSMDPKQMDQMKDAMKELEKMKQN